MWYVYYVFRFIFIMRYRRTQYKRKATRRPRKVYMRTKPRVVRRRVVRVGRGYRRRYWVFTSLMPYKGSKYIDKKLFKYKHHGMNKYIKLSK